MTTNTPLLILAGFALVSAGSALGSLTTVALTGPPPRAQPPSQGDPEEEAAERRALRESIDALTAQLRLGGAAAVRSVEETRSPAGGGSAPAPDGAASRSMDGGDPAHTSGAPPRDVDRRGLGSLVATPSEEQRGLLEGLAQFEYDPLQKVHLFWTYSQILSRYGAPDEVRGEQTMSWYYKDPRSGETVQFVFCEGVLVAIYN